MTVPLITATAVFVLFLIFVYSNPNGPDKFA